MRRFVLDRSEDPSGVSGTGEVAQGVVFPDGTAVMKWGRDRCSLGVYRDIEDVEYIHGHQRAGGSEAAPVAGNLGALMKQKYQWCRTGLPLHLLMLELRAATPRAASSAA
jgi:hypothetical protein